MRRLILEFAIEDVARILGDSSISKIDSLEVLSFLRSTPDEVALICKIRFKDPSTTIEEIMTGEFEEVQILEHEGETFTCFFRQRRPGKASGLTPLGAGGYLGLPYEIDDGRLRGTFLGSAKEVRHVLEVVASTGADYKVVSLSDAKFSPDSPLSHLTDKQRKVILSAFNLGYYDVPRRISSEELAKRLNIREPTLVIHRRKAERRLIAELLRE